MLINSSRAADLHHGHFCPPIPHLLDKRFHVSTHFCVVCQFLSLPKAFVMIFLLSPAEEPLPEIVQKFDLDCVANRTVCACRGKLQLPHFQCFSLRFAQLIAREQIVCNAIHVFRCFRREWLNRRQLFLVFQRIESRAKLLGVTHCAPRGSPFPLLFSSHPDPPPVCR